MSEITFHLNPDHPRKFFFSTSYTQNAPPGFVPSTIKLPILNMRAWSTNRRGDVRTAEDIKRFILDDFEEIPNPDPAFVPDFRKKKGADLDGLQAEMERLLALLHDRQIGVTSRDAFIRESLQNLQRLTNEALAE